MKQKCTTCGATGHVIGISLRGTIEGSSVHGESKVVTIAPPTQQSIRFDMLRIRHCKVCNGTGEI